MPSTAIDRTKPVAFPGTPIEIIRYFIIMQRQAGVQTVAWCRFPQSDTHWATLLADRMVDARLVTEQERDGAREMLLERVKDISLLVDSDIVAVVNGDGEQEDLLAQRPRASMWQPSAPPRDAGGEPA